MEEAHSTPPPNHQLINRQLKLLKKVLGACIGAGVLFAITLIWIAPPMLGKTHRNANLSEAINNVRLIGLALFEFEMDYGSFPSPDTTSLVSTKHPGHGFDLSGSSSNSFFLQLLAAQITQSERIFHARIPGLAKPDNITTPGEALKKGEVGFSYFSGLSSKNDPLTPIVLTPLIPGTTKFDPKPFKGKAIVLRIDSSVVSYTIHKDGHIYDDKSINLLSPKNPIWKGKAPDIRYPE